MAPQGAPVDFRSERAMTCVAPPRHPKIHVLLACVQLGAPTVQEVKSRPGRGWVVGEAPLWTLLRQELGAERPDQPGFVGFGRPAALHAQQVPYGRVVERPQQVGRGRDSEPVR